MSARTDERIRVVGAAPQAEKTRAPKLDRADTAEAPQPATARDWFGSLSPYSKPDTSRSIVEIVTTIVPLALLWWAAWATLSVGYWLTLLIAIPAAFLLVQLFLIQHDCGHGAFFHSRAGNDWTGRVLGVFTLTPYDVWRRSHSIHHASSGNLDRRGVGDLNTLTVAEYNALPYWLRLKYQLYRHPIVMFGIGPAYLFLLQHRLPVGMLTKGWQPWISAMATNAGIALFSALMISVVGWQAFFMVHIPIVAFSASIGVWLFYIQHQFEDTFWAEHPEWTHQEAALYGSSHYDLPQPLRWVTANIGVHHVHHLFSRIPFYRLPQVLRDHPELATIRRVTLMESFAAVRLKLWDEQQRRLVSFREARA